MNKFKNTGNRFFKTTDDMISDVIGRDEIIAICPGDAEVDEREKWDALSIIFGIVILAFTFLLSYLGIDPEYIVYAILLPFGIYGFIKGFRSRPDALVITDQNVWLIHNVFFNKKENSFTYYDAFMIPRSEIKKMFCFSWTKIKFKSPGKLKVLFHQKLSEDLKKHYHKKVINLSDAKKMLFAS